MKENRKVDKYLVAIYLKWELIMKIERLEVVIPNLGFIAVLAIMNLT